jgi:hypothetical protein
MRRAVARGIGIDIGVAVLIGGENPLSTDRCRQACQRSPELPLVQTRR